MSPTSASIWRGSARSGRPTAASSVGTSRPWRLCRSRPWWRIGPRSRSRPPPSFPQRPRILADTHHASRRASCGRYRRHVHGYRRHVGRRHPAREQGVDHAGRPEPRRRRRARRPAEGAGHCARASVEEVLHGTTVGSNTILQRSGARTGLITTRGFRDVLEIGRIRMPDMFDLTWDKPKPLVPRRHRLEVAERIAADGSVVEPLNEASVDRSRRAARGRRHRGDRHLPDQQLPQSGARAAHRGDPARALPRACW